MRHPYRIIYPDGYKRYEMLGRIEAFVLRVSLKRGYKVERCKRARSPVVTKRATFGDS